ncbi:TolC family protein [uncultured Aquimarina sp.]|uniref:TolC family protein n=1 Tax=uncultured Aquimarina sp. TaxID=575652 RepID=UPI002608C711|nr:TolC family protein [uncultured Aquimarina sp.]
MRTKSTPYNLLFFLMITNLSIGQSIIEDYVEEGLKSNLALQQEHQLLSQSFEDLKQAKALFLPNVTFNASYMIANGGRTIDIPVGDLLNPVYTTLNQLTGSENFPINLQNVEEPIIPNDFHDTRLEFKQVIFNTDVYFNYKAKSALTSFQKAKKDAYVQELKKEIKQGYYSYLQSEEVLHIYDSSETVLKELVRINKALVKNNKATKDVVFRAQFELDQLYADRALAVQQHNIAKSYFNFLLNRELNEQIRIDTSLKISEGFLFSDLNTLQTTALSEREELVQLDHVIKANTYAHKIEKYSWIPKFSLGGSIGYQGFGYEFDGNQDYGVLQFNVSIPLFTGLKNKAKKTKTKIQVEQYQTRYQELEQQIRLQVIDAYYNLEASNTVVSSKKSAFESAKENFRIIKRKYEENLVILVEFLDARVQYTNSQLGLVIAQYNVLKKQAELDRVLAL